jgi:succinate dehydrogenase / fumarate reductase membrane anchor subunit
MVKTILSVSHQGLRDWAIQRVSAILMTIYTIGLVSYFILTPELSFYQWHELFAQSWMKIATILFLLCILSHAWVGIWTVYTDYVKSFVLRSILQVTILLMLSACFIWGILIVWSV